MAWVLTIRMRGAAARSPLWSFIQRFPQRRHDFFRFLLFPRVEQRRGDVLDAGASQRAAERMGAPVLRERLRITLLAEQDAGAAQMEIRALDAGVDALFQNEPREEVVAGLLMDARDARVVFRTFRIEQEAFLIRPDRLAGFTVQLVQLPEVEVTRRDRTRQTQ